MDAAPGEPSCAPDGPVARPGLVQHPSCSIQDIVARRLMSVACFSLALSAPLTFVFMELPSHQGCRTAEIRAAREASRFGRYVLENRCVGRPNLYIYSRALYKNARSHHKNGQSRPHQASGRSSDGHPNSGRFPDSLDRDLAALAMA